MTLNVHASVYEFRRACDAVRARGERLGFVPTMGALHAGHMALVDAARARGTTVAVSIFVNPTQFGPTEDLSRYPRPITADLELCRAHAVSHVFLPTEFEVYPPGERTRVRVPGLADGLCGARRPGHFEGVATVVAKFFAVAGPCLAVFGRKDYQQLRVIQRMASDLLLPIEVIGHPIVREADGLALSSRNVYLTPEERSRAPQIALALSRAVRSFDCGERRSGLLRDRVEGELRDAGFRIDYVELTDPDDLTPVPTDAPLPERALLAIAVFLGSTRLIDNVVLGEDAAPLVGAA
jgi:pantoate--beta-alanine ligase